MFENRYNLRKAILFLGDLFLLFCALYASLKIRNFISAGGYYSFSRHFEIFLVNFLVWLVVFYLFDLYNLQKIKSVSFIISNAVIALMINLSFSIIFFYFFPILVTPKTVLILLGVITLFLILANRLFWRQITKNFRSRVAVIGSDEAKIKILKEILEPTESDHEVVGFITLGQESTLLNLNFSLLGNYQDLLDIIKREKIDELIAAFNYYKYPEVTRKITDCLQSGIRISELSLFYEEATGKVPVDFIDQMWFLIQLKTNRKIFDFLSRLGDVICAVLGLMITLPFYPIIALIIKIDSAGSIFYRQVRSGRNEKPFWLIKFRTMVKNAEALTGEVWSSENDSRITRFGRFMRKTRLDELPQLFNVIVGDMSLVGPRPERPKFVEQLKEKIPFYSHRHLVKPGLTGWAQIKYRYAGSEEETLEKLQYDLYYIKNRSLLLYLMIVVRTIRVMFTKVGI